MDAASGGTLAQYGADAVADAAVAAVAAEVAAVGGDCGGVAAAVLGGVGEPVDPIRRRSLSSHFYPLGCTRSRRHLRQEDFRIVVR